jgi:hypothetical protein
MISESLPDIRVYGAVTANPTFAAISRPASGEDVLQAFNRYLCQHTLKIG